MRIERKVYLDKLVESRHNSMIKIITGVRRSGKSFLLFDLFADWLEAEGVSSDYIIKIDLENRRNKFLHNPDNLLEFIDFKMIDKEMYHILIERKFA